MHRNIKTTNMTVARIMLRSSFVEMSSWCFSDVGHCARVNPEVLLTKMYIPITPSLALTKQSIWNLRLTIFRLRVAKMPLVAPISLITSHISVRPPTGKVKTSDLHFPIIAAGIIVLFKSADALWGENCTLIKRLPSFLPFAIRLQPSWSTCQARCSQEEQCDNQSVANTNQPRVTYEIRCAKKFYTQLDRPWRNQKKSQLSKLVFLRSSRT